MCEDSYRHKGMRRQLVDLLRTKGITDQQVLAAVNQVPRHCFFEKAFLEHAYQDKAFPIGHKQTISQPYTVAFQTMLLGLQPGARILEIGTGSGYQAAILSQMGVTVYTIEYLKPLHEKAKYLLTQLGYNNLKFFHGDGSLGLTKYAPFDGIVVTAGAPTVPKALVSQLKDESRGSISPSRLIMAGQSTSR